MDERRTVGILFPVLNNWSGVSVAINSIRSEHIIRPWIVNNSFFGLSVSESWNAGIYTLFSQGCKYVIVCNDDIVFSSFTIDALVKRAEVGDAVLVSAHNVKGLLKEPTEIYSYIPGEDVTEPENPDFSCFLITQECWDKVGAFDENFSPAYYEDNDYHARVVLSGEKAILTTSAPYYHFGSLTINQQEEGKPPIIPQERMLFGQQYFIAKWGHLPVSNPPEMWNLYYRRPFNDLRYSHRDWPDPQDMEKVKSLFVTRTGQV